MNRILVLILILVLGCKEERKTKLNNQDPIFTEIKPKDKEKKYNFPVAENLFEENGLITLTTEPHAFSENIVFEEVNILKKEGDNSYYFILVFDEINTDFENFKKWNIALIATAKDPTKFEDPRIRTKGSKTDGLRIKTVLMGNDVVALGTFKLVPKEFSFLRFYLYDSSNNKNTNYYTLKDVTIP